MTNQDASTTRLTGGPSRRALLWGTLATFAGALLASLVVVLPAEYGIDPTGLGEKIGVTRIAAATAPSVDATPRRIEGVFPPIPAADSFDFFEPEVLGDPYSRSQDAPFRSDRLVIPLDVGEQVEVKTTMKQGNALVYRWALLEGKTIYTDFHADPHAVDLYPDQYWIRYAESESDAGAGSLVAPFDGNHGWYWLNIEEQPVRIELEIHGFYDTIGEIMRSYQ